MFLMLRWMAKPNWPRVHGFGRLAECVAVVSHRLSHQIDLDFQYLLAGRGRASFTLPTLQLDTSAAWRNFLLCNSLVPSGFRAFRRLRGHALPAQPNSAGLHRTHLGVCGRWFCSIRRGRSPLARPNSPDAHGAANTLAGPDAAPSIEGARTWRSEIMRDLQEQAGTSRQKPVLNP